MGESYLRWLGRHLSKIPRAVTAIPKWLRKPFIEFGVGMYGIVFGFIGMILSSGSRMRFLLSNTQWGLVVLVGFFLFTHGIYRTEKETEDSRILGETQELDG